MQLRKKTQARRAALISERTSFVPHWKELGESTAPRRGRFFSTDRNQGTKRHNKIIDNAGLIAARTLSSGMMAGLTSPARPWFKLATHDPDLMEYGPVKEWMQLVERKMREVFNKSNIYNVLPVTYKDLGVFGTSAFLLSEDFEDVVRGYPFSLGEYMLGIDDRLTVNTLYRDIPMTVGQVVSKFGKDNVSSTVKALYNSDKLDSWLTIIHAIEPNDDRIPNLKDAQNKAYRSSYFEEGADDDKVLGISGYDEFPIMAPRWEVSSGDIYGTSCPGMEALGDIRQLQIEQKKKAQGIAKMIDPPMSAPSTLETKRASVLPGDITYLDVTQGGQGFVPTYQINPQIGELKEDIRDVKERIDTAFYADLFLMLASTDRRHITAREVEERHEEKLLMLGPVLERLNDELLDPMIDRTFAIMERAGILPEPPEELAEEELKVEYISTLAQAQQAVGIGAIERLVGAVTEMAGANPEVVDKIDFDQTVDELAGMLGTPTRMVRTDDAVAETRTGRNEAEGSRQQAEQMAAAADGAKVLSETNTEGKNMLTDLVESGGLPGVSAESLAAATGT